MSEKGKNSSIKISSINNVNLKNKIINDNTDKISSPRKSSSKTNILGLIDSLDFQKQAQCFDEGSMLFRKKIDKLNLKFFVETENYLTNKNETNSDNLFLILFKQISIYSEEINRLNLKLLQFKNDMMHDNNFKNYNTDLINTNNQVNDNDNLKLISSLKNEIQLLKSELKINVESQKAKKDIYSLMEGSNNINVRHDIDKNNINIENSKSKLNNVKSDQKQIKSIIITEKERKFNNYDNEYTLSNTNSINSISNIGSGNNLSSAFTKNSTISLNDKGNESNSNFNNFSITKSNQTNLTNDNSSLLNSKSFNKKRNLSDNDPKSTLSQKYGIKENIVTLASGNSKKQVR